MRSMTERSSGLCDLHLLKNEILGLYDKSAFFIILISCT